MNVMRAKMQVREVILHGTVQEQLKLSCVGGSAPFGKDGESEDNSFARWTPSGDCSLVINNPNLLGKFKMGQKFYLDFTEAAE